ncbi:MAG: hypothetical protein RL634_279 [Bacteroidota bacterium]|jgi:YbgC/YbaW family acyl-CoA thioester hydrolase
MRKNKIEIPTAPCFTTKIDIQISDINYGGHVGNERYLLFAQETRLRFLSELGFSEIKFGEHGLVLAEATVEYFHELFYGDQITVELSIGEIGRASFECFYAIEVIRAEKKMMAAKVETKMACFDYSERKIKSIPDHLKKILEHCALGNPLSGIPNLP